MPKERLYSVSYISFFDNEMHTAFVITSEGEMEALRSGLRQIMQVEDDNPDGTGFDHCKTLEEAKELAFNTDSMLDVKRYRRSEAIQAR